MTIKRDSGGRFVKGNKIRLGTKATEETKLKISKSHLGQIPWNKGLRGVQKSWNKGLTKADHPSIKKISERLKGNKLGFKKGYVPWNKGLKGGTSGSFKPNDKRLIGNNYQIIGRLKQSKHERPTNIERRLYQFLEQKKVYFEKQKLINKKFLVDAFIPNLNLIIEADGNYWHNLSSVKKRDRAKNAYLKKCGYNLLRLRESEIMNGSYERRILNWL